MSIFPWGGRKADERVGMQCSGWLKIILRHNVLCKIYTRKEKRRNQQPEHQKQRTKLTTKCRRETRCRTGPTSNAPCTLRRACSGLLRADAVAAPSGARQQAGQRRRETAWGGPCRRQRRHAALQSKTRPGRREASSEPSRHTGCDTRRG